MQVPSVVHLDADAFFVSCEQALDPSLRGTKCAVGGRERGIISSASYEARACGVYTPMPTKSALRVCPDLILIRHTAGLYGTMSRRMFDLCETLTPVVQRNSIDEGYLDVAPCGFKSLAEVETAVRRLQRRLWDELHVPASMGIAANRLVAQIASKLKKPGGFVVVPPGDEAGFLAPLPIGKLPGIGPKTEASLTRRGLRLIGDILEHGEAELHALFGSGWRDAVAMARGVDDRPVEPDREDAKSYSQQETFFKDIGDFAEIERVAKRMLDELMPKIRADRKRVRTVMLKLRYPDFTHDSRSHTLAEPTDLEAPFYPHVAPLLRSAWRKRSPLRLVSVRLSGITGEPSQTELFAETIDRQRRLAAVLDRLSHQVKRGHQLQEPE